jgi:peptidoglycan/xylan/chitin deacetylase (PgdA/CDA1 family)
MLVVPSEGDSLRGASANILGYRNYSSVHVDGPYIAITFDDGPSPTLTPRLLDILKEKGVKATFFVIGQNVAHSPDIVARASSEGHEIGSHSWSHPVLTKLSDDKVHEELQKTSEAILSATGKKPTLLRPPYGAINPHLSRMIEGQEGLTIVLWSVDPLDWKSPGSSVLAERLIAGSKPGAITLSHDIKPGTIEAIPHVIDALKAKGYQFVTVSELIALESKVPAQVTKATASATATKVKTKKHKGK